MTDKEKIRAKIERLRKSYQIKYQELDCTSPEIMSVCAKRNLCQDILSFIDSMQEEPVSEDLEEAAQRYNEDMSWCWEAPKYPHLEAFKAGANWKKERIMANSTNATIGLPYENKYGGYTHLIDVLRPLPVGKNKIAIIFKED